MGKRKEQWKMGLNMEEPIFPQRNRNKGIENRRGIKEWCIGLRRGSLLSVIFPREYSFYSQFLHRTLP